MFIISKILGFFQCFVHAFDMFLQKNGFPNQKSPSQQISQYSIEVLLQAIYMNRAQVMIEVIIGFSG